MVAIMLFFISLLTMMSCRPEYDEFLTIDVFSSTANYQGIQGGWFGKVVKDKFNMELNIIAPNVAGGGDMLYETRSSAGNLGDIVMIGAENGQLADAVAAGLLIDLTKYQKLMPHAMVYSAGIVKLQTTINDFEGIYAIPSSVTSYEATDPSETTEPIFGPYVRWDLYEELDFPVIETLEDLLPVLKDMQELEPETDSGDSTYAFTLFKDWDGNMMIMAKQPACFYGYDEVGFVLSKADGSDNASIIADDSPYLRSLRFYFNANQMGLVDPESTTQNWESVWNKYVAGQILFSPWPWLGQNAYNTLEHLQGGKGFMMLSIEDMQIFSYGATPAGENYVVGIGSNTKDPRRMAKFIDWLYSPEGIMMSTDQIGSTGGPENLTWEWVDGEPTLTSFGIDAMLGGGAIAMPEGWGDGSWSQGISQLNFVSVLAKDINPCTGQPYDFRLWDSYIEFTSTDVHISWQTQMEAMTTFEYLENQGKVIVAPGTDYVQPAEPQAISNIRDACKSIIVQYSWKMVFAEDETEFEALLDEMQDKVVKLGYNQVLTYDLQIAQALNDARDAARD